MNKEVKERLDALSSTEFKVGSCFSAQVMEDIKEPSTYLWPKAFSTASAVLLLLVLVAFDNTDEAHQVVTGYSLHELNPSSEQDALNRLTALLAGSFGAALSIAAAALASFVLLVKRSKVMLIVFSVFIVITLFTETVLAVLGPSDLPF